MKVRFLDIPWPLLIVALCIASVGLAFVWSSSYRSGPWGEGHRLPYFMRQAAWVCAGVLLFFGVQFVHYLRLERSAYVIYFACVVLLLGLLLFGSGTRGVRRWISLGPVNIQPSELMKIAYIIGMAKYLMHQRELHLWRSLVGPIALTMLPAALIVVQPNLGTTMMLVPIFLVMLFAAGARPRNLLVLIGAGVAMLPVLYFMMAGYQRARIEGWLRPERWPRTFGYQLTQSITAVGSGGFFGKGFGQGTQNTLNFLPERHTDFIFAVIGEEWGFAGCLVLLALFLVLILLCLGVADRSTEPFGRLLCVGFATLVGAQLLVNTGMTIGLMPITGLPLPFVSYGGSSMIASFAGLALVANVSMRNVPTFMPTTRYY